MALSIIVAKEGDSLNNEKHVKNSESPMIVQGSDPNKIVCKDCEFRDKRTFEHNGKIIPIGAIKSWCKVYTKENSNGKPIGVLMRNEKCEYYMKEDT